MALPTLSGVGRLTAPPELRFTAGGKAVCKIRLAFNSRRKNPSTQEWEDGDVYYVDGTLWDREAENAAESLDKGMEVCVSGELKTRQYEKEGEKRSTTELNIRSIGPSLKFATATVQKMDRSSTGGQQRSVADDPWGSPRPSPAGDDAGRFDDGPPF